MKVIINSIILISLLTMQNFGQEIRSFYDYEVESIDGNTFPLSSLKGKKILVVNTASKCGFTPQYADLQKLYELYGGDHFTIIGFPANNFLRQEPGTNDEIREFCTLNYGVTFPMMSKISVKGDDMAPLYQWLTSKSLNGKMDSKVQWNFQKYLIDENGNLVDVAYSKESPLSEKIVNWIKGD